MDVRQSKGRRAMTFGFLQSSSAPGGGGWRNAGGHARGPLGQRAIEIEDNQSFGRARGGWRACRNGPKGQEQSESDSNTMEQGLAYRHVHVGGAGALPSVRVLFPVEDGAIRRPGVVSPKLGREIPGNPAPDVGKGGSLSR